MRDDVDQVAAWLRHFIEVLAPIGYFLYEQDSISEHPIYGWKSSEGFHKSNASHLIESRPLLRHPRVLQTHLKRIRDGLQDDPAQTISSCKELLESLSKIILTKSEIVYSNVDDLPSLYRKVAESLQLKAESVTGNAKVSHTSQRNLRTLFTTVQSLAELRNELGLGHDRENLSTSFNRHARLSSNATVTVTGFLLDTWQDRVDRGDLTLPSRGAVINLPLSNEID